MWVGVCRTLLKVRDGKRFMVTALGFTQPSKISRFAHVDSLGRHSLSLLAVTLSRPLMFFSQPITYIFESYPPLSSSSSLVDRNLRLYVVLIGAAKRTNSFGAQLGSTKSRRKVACEPVFEPKGQKSPRGPNLAPFPKLEPSPCIFHIPNRGVSIN